MPFEDAWDSLIDGDEGRPGGDGDKSGDDDGDDDGNGEDDGYSPLMESEDLKDSLELDDEAVAIVEGHCPGDDEVQCEKDPGLTTSDLNASMRRQKSKEEEFIDRAVKEGDNSMIRVMRKAMAKRELSSHGRNTQLYDRVAGDLSVERELRETGKRARIAEAKEQDIRETQEKRLLAAAEITNNSF